MGNSFRDRIFFMGRADFGCYFHYCLRCVLAFENALFDTAFALELETDETPS